MDTTPAHPTGNASGKDAGKDSKPESTDQPTTEQGNPDAKSPEQIKAEQEQKQKDLKKAQDDLANASKNIETLEKRIDDVATKQAGATEQADKDRYGKELVKLQTNKKEEENKKANAEARIKALQGK